LEAGTSANRQVDSTSLPAEIWVDCASNNAGVIASDSVQPDEMLSVERQQSTIILGGSVQ
jgi:hypothetical protein